MLLPGPRADGTVYVGANDGKVYAVNANGTLQWAYLTTSLGIAESSPAIGVSGTIYIGALDGKVYAITPSGTLAWAVSTGNQINSSPAIGADGTIYIGSSSNDSLYAITPGGMIKWAFPTGDHIYSSPAIGADGTIYVGSVDHNLYAITDHVTYCTQKWAFLTGSPITDSSPAIGPDGTVFIGSSGGLLYSVYSAMPSFLITKSVSPAFAAPGDLVTYTINYENIGVTATNVVLSDMLSGWLLNYVANSATGNATYNFGMLKWPLGTLATNAFGQVTFQATVSYNATVGSPISNTASISCAEASNIPVNVPASFMVVSSANDWWMFNHDAQHSGCSPFVGPSAPSIKWTTGISSMSSPSLGWDGTIYYGWEANYQYALYALDPVDSSVKWFFGTDGPIVSSPAIGTDGAIYVGAEIPFPPVPNPQGILYAINPEGTERWEFPTNGSIDSSPALGADGTVYVGSDDGHIYALDWAFGTLHWKYPPEGSIGPIVLLPGREPGWLDSLRRVK